VSAADTAKKIVQDMTGMWWPDADESGLRDAAKTWRDFADDLEKVTAAANKSARGIIEHNKGEAISAFDDPFNGQGHLIDTAGAPPRSIARSPTRKPKPSPSGEAYASPSTATTSSTTASPAPDCPPPP
jgi:hypothetical protein